VGEQCLSFPCKQKLLLKSVSVVNEVIKLLSGPAVEFLDTLPATNQGCQILLGVKHTKTVKIYHMATKYIYQMDIMDIISNRHRIY
jgi:hypothetical protein